MPLTRADILNALDLPTALVNVPRWGGEVLVKAMPVANSRFTAYVTGSSDHKQKGAISPREDFTRRMIGAVILCALDPDTEAPMFKWSDADALRDKHWNSVLIVANKAYELAGDPDDEMVAAMAPEGEDDEANDEPAEPKLRVVEDSPEDAPDSPLEG